MPVCVTVLGLCCVLVYDQFDLICVCVVCPCLCVLGPCGVLLCVCCIAAAARIPQLSDARELKSDRPGPPLITSGCSLMDASTAKFRAPVLAPGSAHLAEHCPRVIRRRARQPLSGAALHWPFHLPGRWHLKMAAAVLLPTVKYSSRRLWPLSYPCETRGWHVLQESFAAQKWEKLLFHQPLPGKFIEHLNFSLNVFSVFLTL